MACSRSCSTLNVDNYDLYGAFLSSGGVKAGPGMESPAAEGRRRLEANGEPVRVGAGATPEHEAASTIQRGMGFITLFTAYFVEHNRLDWKVR